MNELQATLLSDDHDIDSDGVAPGSYKFYRRIGSDVEAGMVFTCPCGCGQVGALQFFGVTAEVSRPSWTWNGSRDKPTLTPSILKRCNCKWHGYLTDGVFKKC